MIINALHYFYFSDRDYVHLTTVNNEAMVIAGLIWCTLDQKPPQMFQYLMEKSKIISKELISQREDMDATTRSYFREQRRELFLEWGISKQRRQGK